VARYTIGEVKIDGCYPIREILELSMDVGVNRHGFFTYGGLISEDAAKRYIQQNADRQVVKVSLRNELEFCGFPQVIAINHQNDHYYLRITLVTSSLLMDTEPHDRFFQDKGQTCTNILTEAYNDSKIGILSAMTAKDRVFKPILQYHETDWQLTLRMASNICTVVIPNITSEEPQVMLGVPNRQVRNENNNIVYTINRNNCEFRHKSAIFIDVDYHNFLRYNIKSHSRYKLGDSIRIEDKKFTVVQKSLEYEKGEIQEYYSLGHEQEFAFLLHQKERITGLELEGKVMIRSSQEMKILLDIDSKRKNAGETWFSYSPVSNNGMYSMPLENEKVMLQWQSDLDNDVLVVRPNRKNSYDMLDPGERHFLTEHENHLMMIPNKVEYTNPVGSMQWLASRGFDISTNKNMSISAQHNVNIKSQAQVEVNSPERITTCKAGVESSIDMISNELHIKAVKKVKATSKANKYKMTKLPERMRGFTISAATASKLAAAIPQVSNIKK